MTSALEADIVSSFSFFMAMPQNLQNLTICSRNMLRESAAASTNCKILLGVQKYRNFADVVSVLPLNKRLMTLNILVAAIAMR